MAQRVVRLDLSVEWEPNAPDAVLVVRAGLACLAVLPHPDDADQRNLVFVWQRCIAAEMGAPNDEAVHMHPLYGQGLDKVLWVGEVLESERLAIASAMVFTPPSRHFLLRLKEGLVEVLAHEVEVHRSSGSTAAAAFAWSR